MITCCKSDKFRSVIIGDVKAFGDIDKDTTFNGLIIFSDIHTGRIVRECNYLNGVIHGEDREYYDNGQLSLRCDYDYGKQNGSLFIYDKDGKIVQNNYFFYDIRVGNNTEYKNGILSNYNFYSLENNILFSLNYDSLKHKRITDLQSNYFFYHFNQYSDFSSEGGNPEKRELFVYTPSPPRFKFEYSLVAIDSTYKVLKVYRRIDNIKPWSIIEIEDDSAAKINKLSLQLIISDSINDKTINLYKRI
jgi:hypothetical protein